MNAWTVEQVDPRRSSPPPTTRATPSPAARERSSKPAWNNSASSRRSSSTGPTGSGASSAGTNAETSRSNSSGPPSPSTGSTSTRTPRRALNVLLNNEEAQSSWEPEQLVDVLASIEETPMLELTGFDFDQWQQLQVDVGAATKVGREGTVRSPAKKGTRTKTRPGHVWKLGQHLLVIGDATHPESYEHLPEPAQMMFTDPPYNVDYKGRTSDELAILNDAMTDAEYLAFIADFAKAVTPHLAGAAYMCHATRTQNEVRAALRLTGWHESSIIAWVKQHFVMGRSDYHWMWEPIWYGWPPDTKRHWVGDRNQGNVWEHGDTPAAKRASGRMRNRGKQQSTTKTQTDVWKHPRPSANRDHPTMKPVALVEHALRNSSEPNRWVLDPMAGSGSTIVAAENLGRRCYAVELDPIYADVILDRYKSLEGAEKPERIHP